MKGHDTPPLTSLPGTTVDYPYTVPAGSLWQPVPAQ